MTPVLHAPGDVVRDVEAHLDELARRSAVVMMAFLIGAVGAWWWFDAWFVTLLQQVAGATTTDLAFYGPHDVARLKWGSIAIVGLITSSPMIAYQFNAFASPGMLGSERALLARVCMLAPLVLIAIVIMLMAAFGPVFHFGLEYDRSLGFEPRYDILAWYSMSIAILWCATVSMLICVIGYGITRSWIASGERFDPWRVRLHLVQAAMLLIGVGSHAEALWLPFTMLSAVTLELCMVRTDGAVNAVTRYDAHGARRRVAIVDCSCYGTLRPFTKDRSRGCAHHTTPGLCASESEVERLLEHAMHGGWTDMVITGCDLDPLPAPLIDDAGHLRIRLHGLDVRKEQFKRTSPCSEPADQDVAHWNRVEILEHGIIRPLPQIGAYLEPDAIVHTGNSIH